LRLRERKCFQGQKKENWVKNEAEKNRKLWLANARSRLEQGGGREQREKE